MSEAVVSSGLDIDQTFKLLDSAISDAAHSTNYRLRGLLIAPDASDPARPLAVADMVTLRTDHPNYTTEAEYARICPSLAGENTPRFARSFHDDRPRPKTILYLPSGVELSKGEILGSSDARDDSVSALHAIKQVLNGLALPLAGMWYARTPKADIVHDHRKRIESQSTVHIQATGEPDELRRHATLAALLGAQVGDTPAGQIAIMETEVPAIGKVVQHGRTYHLTIGFGAMAETRRYMEEQGVNTIPPVIPQMRIT